MTIEEQKYVRTCLSGDEAVAYAVKHANVDVIAAYPITPQTIMVEILSEFVHDGELDAEFVPVESEHTALSAAIGASLAGARVFTATASQGLALMYEILYVASSIRAPVVMALANRALNLPLNIHCSHDDAYAARDSGWIQLFAENVQEVYDLVLTAFRIAEDKRILFPVIVNLDGFILTHCVEPLNIWKEEYITEFLPPREPVNPVNWEKPMTYGPVALPDYYMKIKRGQYEAIRKVMPYIKEILSEYSRWSGRKYDILKMYGMEDAEYAFIVLGSTAGTLRDIIKKWREKGRKVGVISLTVYRPFPVEELRKVLAGLKAVAIMDRSHTYGGPAAQLYMDVATALYDLDERPRLLNVIYGLGGRDFTPADAEDAYQALMDPTKKEVWVSI